MSVIEFKKTDRLFVLKEIVDLFSHEPPIEIIIRLINSFHRVMSRRRNNFKKLV